MLLLIYIGSGGKRRSPNHTTLELICLVLGSLPQNHILSGLLGKSRWPLPQSSLIACLYWDCCPNHLCHHMLMWLPPTCSQFSPFHTTLLAPSSKCFDFAPPMLSIPLIHAFYSTCSIVYGLLSHHKNRHGLRALRSAWEIGSLLPGSQLLPSTPKLVQSQILMHMFIILAHVIFAQTAKQMLVVGGHAHTKLCSVVCITSV